MDIDDKLKQMEQELEKKTRELERKLDEGLGGSTAKKEATPATQARAFKARDLSGKHNFLVNMSREKFLGRLDEIMEEDFNIRSFFGKSMSAYPTVFCETPREIISPLLAAEDWPDAAKEGYIAEQERIAATGQTPPGIGFLGYHLPGVGCFINGWGIANDMGLEPRQVLDDPVGFGQVVNTAAHEKWGHGFISEITSTGVDKQSVQLNLLDIVSRFKLRDVDTPQRAKLMEQHVILFESSVLLEEGFATWTERWLAESMAEREQKWAHLPDSAPIYTPEEVAGTFRSIGQDNWARSVECLFPAHEPSPDQVHEILQEHWPPFIEALNGADEVFAAGRMQPPPYVIGFLMLNYLAQRQGAKCVPYAVATAANVSYGLENVSNHDLRNFVNNNPDLNLNRRFLSLMYLHPGRPNDVGEFLGRCREEAGLAPPAPK